MDRPRDERVRADGWVRFTVSRRLAAAANWLRALLAVVARPRLWWPALRQVARIARPQWWRRAPFLPVPPAGYLRFRLETAYGSVTAPPPRDLVAYIEWCSDAPRRARTPPTRSPATSGTRQ
jgi:hypothetical protein